MQIPFDCSQCRLALILYSNSNDSSFDQHYVYPVKDGPGLPELLCVSFKPLGPPRSGRSGGGFKWLLLNYNGQTSPAQFVQTVVVTLTVFIFTGAGHSHSNSPLRAPSTGGGEGARRGASRSSSALAAFI